jgi:uncharacterized protein
MNIILLMGIIVLIISVFMSMVGKGGGKFAIKSKPKYLKMIFALTNLAAGIMMIINIII